MKLIANKYNNGLERCSQNKTKGNYNYHHLFNHLKFIIFIFYYYCLFLLFMVRKEKEEKDTNEMSE
jgi:hypothetical protein